MLKSFAVLSALLLSPAVMAQDAPPPSGSGPQPEQIVAFMDVNKDGFIAQDEAQGPLVQYFAVVDVDKDEKISLEELKTAMAAMRPPEPAQSGSQ